MGSKSKNIVWKKTKVDPCMRKQLNGHKSCVLWFTGLSGSGKSTLAIQLEKELYLQSIRTYILDGDNLRHGLNKNLGFSPEDRTENIRRMGEVAKLFVNAGLITLVASISPYKKDRNQVRSLFASDEFIEVYVKCSLDECERRDPKGLYKRARGGEIESFTGISAPYEAPEKQEILIESDKLSLQDSVQQIIQFLKDHHYLEWNKGLG